MPAPGHWIFWTKNWNANSTISKGIFFARNCSLPVHASSRGRIVHEMLFNASSVSSVEEQSTTLFPFICFISWTIIVVILPRHVQQKCTLCYIYLKKWMLHFFVRIFGIQIDFKFLVLLYVNRAVGFDANFKKVGSQFAISHGRVQLCAENLPGL
jgi:hypothetical protein